MIMVARLTLTLPSYLPTHLFTLSSNFIVLYNSEIDLDFDFVLKNFKLRS
jgi:hypothetical protein